MQSGNHAATRRILRPYSSDPESGFNRAQTHQILWRADAGTRQKPGDFASDIRHVRQSAYPVCDPEIHFVHDLPLPANVSAEGLRACEPYPIPAGWRSSFPIAPVFAIFNAADVEHIAELAVLTED